MSPADFGLVTSKFDLTLSISQQIEGLRLNLTYRCGRYHRARMERMLDHYVRGELLTYQALDQSSSRLAHYLRSLGVEKNVIVAIFMERGNANLVPLSGATHIEAYKND